jgi:hypothetical protein
MFVAPPAARGTDCRAVVERQAMKGGSCPSRCRSRDRIAARAGRVPGNPVVRVGYRLARGR